MTVTLTLTQEDPMNTTVVDRGRPIYEIETRGRVISKTTTLRRMPKQNSTGVSSASEGEIKNRIVAEVEWHWSRPSSVSFCRSDRKMPLNMFLHRNRVFDLKSRMFVAPDGKEYVWKARDGHLELLEKTSNTLVAESHGAGLDVQESATGFMDHVVLTFLFMRKTRRLGLK